MAEPFNQNWFGGAGDPKGLQPQNNLSDLDNPEEARKFLGLLGAGDVKKLVANKTNNSVLHIGGSGSSIVCANNDGMPAEFTWCRTIKMNWADWEAVSANAYIDGTNLGFGASSTLGAAFTKRSTNALGFIYRNVS